ncbi:MAG: (d)CMP kinase, partial [Bacteroidota bacterium]
RVRRRQVELQKQGLQVDLEPLRKEIADRDRKDATRDASPLVNLPDAIEFDTSNLTIEEQVRIVVEKAKEIIRRQNQRL